MCPGSLYGERVRFFREGADSAPITDIAGRLDMEFTNPTRNGEYRIPVRYKSMEGIARYSLIHRAGGDRPTLIYHHGSGETNYTARIRKILPASVRSEFNLIALSVPFNRNMKEYIHGIGSLERFAFLVASSVRLIEDLGQWLRSQGSGKTVVSGISLGGWICNLHFAIYTSLDEYRPIFAGAALDHVFLETVYRKQVSRRAFENPSALTRVLNFEKSFSAQKNDRVFPLLARYDQFIRYERQKGIYRENQLRLLDKGHITGAMDIKSLRDHLLEGLS